MGKLFNKYKWMQLFLGLLLIVAGIVTIVISFVNMSVVSLTLSIIIAVILFAFGGFMLLATILEDRVAFFTPAVVYGSIIIATGVILCIQNHFIEAIIIYLVAVFGIASGTVEIVKAILLIKYHSKAEWIIASFILGTLALALGITCLCLPGTMLKFVYVSLGVLFISAGIAQTVYGAKLLKL